MDNFREIQIKAAEDYLFFKQNRLAGSVRFVYEETYNFLLKKLRG